MQWFACLPVIKEVQGLNIGNIGYIGFFLEILLLKPVMDNKCEKYISSRKIGLTEDKTRDRF